MDQRKHARCQVKYRGSLLGERARVEVHILDLSVAGCRASAPVAVKRGELLELRVNVPRDKHPLFVTLAMVRWSDGQVFGIEFMGMAVEDLQRLRDLIRERSTDGMQQT